MRSLEEWSGFYSIFRFDRSFIHSSYHRLCKVGQGHWCNPSIYSRVLFSSFLFHHQLLLCFCSDWSKQKKFWGLRVGDPGDLDSKLVQGTSIIRRNNHSCLDCYCYKIMATIPIFELSMFRIFWLWFLIRDFSFQALSFYLFALSKEGNIEHKNQDLHLFWDVDLSKEATMIWNLEHRSDYSNHAI